MSAVQPTPDPIQVLEKIVAVMEQMARVNDLWCDIAAGDPGLTREGDEFQVEMLQVVMRYMQGQLLPASSP